MECDAMIVDDSPFMRKLLKTILEANGCKVVAEAVDGDEAIIEYSQKRPSIIFMDLVMPNISGVEATKRILSVEKNAKIVMCSTMGHQDLVDIALNSGAMAVLMKPYRVNQVKDIVQRLYSNN